MSKQGKLEDAVRFLQEALELHRTLIPNNKADIALSE